MSSLVLLMFSDCVQALNVVIRMDPTLRYPFNVRSFFTPRETSDIGGGIVLWRGYFQSVRPAIGRMLINVDISTAAMYKPGRLIDIALEVLELTSRGPLSLSRPSPERGLPERERIRLQRFLSSVRINVNIPGQPVTGRRPPRVVKRLTKVGANGLSFTMRNEETITVAAYFEKVYNHRLQFPDIVCIEVCCPVDMVLDCPHSSDEARSPLGLSTLWNFAPSPRGRSCANSCPQRKSKAL